MATTHLQSAILDGGIFWNNFFNGRMLSGEDLSQEQTDNHVARQRLGRALGDGIAYGLEVAASLNNSSPLAPTVTVTQGLAVNRQGQTLALAQDTEVALVRPTDPSVPSALGFGECAPTQPGVYIAGAGIYLLTLAPATGSDGKAPVSGLGNIAATCNTRYTVEGVQFRLFSLNNSLSAELSDPGQLRNLAAYRCFGVDAGAWLAATTDPFGPPVTHYGLLDDLRGNSLTDCDVPLALIYWTVQGIQFIDLWAVRRRIMTPAPNQDWIMSIGNRRIAEAEAMFLQFQAQIAEMRANESNLGSFTAASRFRYLPPIGLLPLASSSSARGFYAPNFFLGKKLRGPIFIEGARLETLIRATRHLAPIDLASAEMIWAYSVRENYDPSAGGGAPAVPYLVFARGNAPDWSEARFDVARWNYSNLTIDALNGRGVFS